MSKNNYTRLFGVMDDGRGKLSQLQDIVDFVRIFAGHYIPKSEVPLEQDFNITTPSIVPCITEIDVIFAIKKLKNIMNVGDN